MKSDRDDHFYQFEIPPGEREIIAAIIAGVDVLEDCLKQSPPTFHSFAIGALMAAVGDVRDRIPVTWSQLLTLRADMMKDSKVVRRDLPNRMVEITAPGFHCIRKKADWEP